VGFVIWTLIVPESTLPEIISDRQDAASQAVTPGRTGLDRLIHFSRSRHRPDWRSCWRVGFGFRSVAPASEDFAEAIAGEGEGPRTRVAMHSTVERLLKRSRMSASGRQTPAFIPTSLPIRLNIL
jgi:hypothetical protein